MQGQGGRTKAEEFRTQVIMLVTQSHAGTGALGSQQQKSEPSFLFTWETHRETSIDNTHGGLAPREKSA